MTTLDAGELDRLEALAAEARDAHWAADWNDHSMGSGPVCAAFIAACDPDTIRRLVAMARSASGEAAAREFVESLTPALRKPAPA